MKTIRQSKVVRTLNGHCRVGDVVIFGVLGAAPRGSRPTFNLAGSLVDPAQRATLSK
jgi:hypothetical protein